MIQVEVMKNVATSERVGSRVLADSEIRSLEQLMGCGEPGKSCGSFAPALVRGLASQTVLAAECAAAIDGPGEFQAVELKGRVEISQEAFLIAESKAFLIEAAATRQDRLTLYCMNVLRYMVEAGH